MSCLHCSGIRSSNIPPYHQQHCYYFTQQYICQITWTCYGRKIYIILEEVYLVVFIRNENIMADFTVSIIILVICYWQLWNRKVKNILALCSIDREPIWSWGTELKPSSYASPRECEKKREKVTFSWFRVIPPKYVKMISW